jgi:hypothetical protein
MNKLISLGSLGLTLTLSSLLAVTPANAERSRMLKFKGELVYLCPQFNNIQEQIEAIKQSPNPDAPICSEPYEQPERTKSQVKSCDTHKETKLLHISKLTQSEPQLEKQRSCWKWYASAGWVWIC